MRLGDGVKIVSAAAVAHEDDEETDETAPTDATEETTSDAE